MHSSFELVFTLLWTSQGVPIALVIWGRSVCNEHGALYHYGGPQSAGDIGPLEHPISLVFIGGSPYSTPDHFSIEIWSAGPIFHGKIVSLDQNSTEKWSFGPKFSGPFFR